MLTAVRLRRAVVAAVIATLALAATAQARPQYRGVQVHSLWGSVTDAQMDRDLDMAAGAGANVVRVDVSWAGLEETRGDFSGWYEQRVDRFMDAAGQRGLKVIATLWETPCWASTAPDDKKQGCVGAWWDRGVTRYPPADASDYGDAVRFFVNRYSSHLAALEVWNEPNLTTYLKGSDPDASYAALVRAAYPAADHRVPVLAGSLSYGDVDFLQASLYAHGAKGSYDGLSIHPYADGRAPDVMGDLSWREYTFAGGISMFHDAATAAGDDAPIWVTEFGWPTCSLTSCNTLTEQAEYIGQSFDVLDGFAYVKGATVYQLRDMFTDAADPEANFGMLREDYSPRPAYAALRAALTAPTGSSDSSTPTTTTGDGSAGGVPPTKGRRKASTRRRAALVLRVKRRRGRVVAYGRAPKGQTVRLSVLRRAPAKRWTVVRSVRLRVGRSGRFVRRVGSVRALRGHAVRAAVAGRRTARIARVR